MSNVSGIGDAYYWSVFKIAEAFGLVTGSFKPSGLFPPALQK